MNVISFSRLRLFFEAHPESEPALRRWYKIAKNANWQNLNEMRADFPHADLVGICTVFNIKGNDFRLITKVYYPETILVRAVLTHSDYDSEKWKDDCECD